MHPLAERARYESDFGVAWTLLPLLIAVPLAAAAGIAWLLSFAYFHHWYLIMLLPGLGGLALGGVLYGVVGLTHCRNRWLAGVVGVLAGLVAYLGYYQCCLARILPGTGWRIDLLPRYIVFRMNTDVAIDLGRLNVGRVPRKPFVPLNWFTFGAELFLAAGPAAALAWHRARRAYCPDLGQWMRREAALLPTNSSRNFCAALEADTLPEFVAGTLAGSAGQQAGRLILEYADPDDGSILTYLVYASLEDFPDPRPWYWPRQMRRTVLRQVELEPAEVLTLRPLFPELARRLELKHAALRDMPAEVGPAPGAEAPVSEWAEITAVPEPFRQRVRGKGYGLSVNLRGAIPGVYFLGGAGGIGLGVWLITEGSLPAGCAASAAGAAAFLWGAYTGLYCLGVPENRWIERRLREEIGQRLDDLVEPQDPESVYVSLIPRESFAKIRWTMASDLLLLKLHERRRQILLEGDSDRYRIPAGAIAACEPQCFFHPADPHHANELWMVRLLVRAEAGMRELLLSVGHTRWTPLTNARRRRVAEEMCRRIKLLGQYPRGQE
jgi:hypothetical protein